MGTLITGKPNQGVGRLGGLLGVSATPATRRVLVIWAGALSRNAERTLIRRLKPAASPALMERGAALRAGKIARRAMGAPKARWVGFA